LGSKSHVVRASGKGASVRTTIPMEIARELRISVGDVLDWSIEKRDGRKVAVIRKLE